MPPAAKQIFLAAKKNFLAAEKKFLAAEKKNSRRGKFEGTRRASDFRCGKHPEGQRRLALCDGNEVAISTTSSQEEENGRAF